MKREKLHIKDNEKVAYILELTSKSTGLSVKEIRQTEIKNRRGLVSEVRQFVIFMIRKNTKYGVEEIAEYFKLKYPSVTYSYKCTSNKIELNYCFYKTNISIKNTENQINNLIKYGKEPINIYDFVDKALRLMPERRLKKLVDKYLIV